MPRDLFRSLKDQRGTFPIYLSFFALAAFLLLIVFGPGIGNKLGFLGERKEQQKSLAQTVRIDTDIDGFSDAIENYLGTNPNRSCPTTTTANDEAIDAWPPDFNDNRVVQFDDVNAVSSRFNRAAQGANRRYDLNGDGWIRIDDVYAVSSRFNQKCTPYKLSASVRTTGAVYFSWAPPIEATASDPRVTDQPKPVLAIIDLTKVGELDCNVPDNYSSKIHSVVLESGAVSYSWIGGTAGHNYCAAILLAGLFYPSGFGELLSNSVNFTIPSLISPTPTPTCITVGDAIYCPTPTSTSTPTPTSTSKPIP